MARAFEHGGIGGPGMSGIALCRSITSGRDDSAFPWRLSPDPTERDRPIIAEAAGMIYTTPAPVRRGTEEEP